MREKFDHFTPRELAYVLTVQGILSGSEDARRYPYDVVNEAMKITDILMDRIEQLRGEDSESE